MCLNGTCVSLCDINKIKKITKMSEFGGHKCKKPFFFPAISNQQKTLFLDHFFLEKSTVGCLGKFQKLLPMAIFSCLDIYIP